MKKYFPAVALVCILGLAAFLRLYRTADFLGFWYDQGRDALVVWDMLYNHRFFLIGPTTGIEGIFLGPFYYYLIAPFYALGRGNPVFPAVGLVAVNLLGIYVLYEIGRRYFNTAIGLLAAGFVSFSAPLAGSHRWLSNPTPLPLFALLAVWSLLSLVHRTKKTFPWIVLGLCLGLSLQLEAASATFFLPATLFTLLLFHKSVSFSFPKIINTSFFFLATLLPQLWFDWRHQHLLFNSLYRFLVGDNSFRPGFISWVIPRFGFYFQAFTGKFVQSFPARLLFFAASAMLALFSYSRLPKKAFWVLLIWWFTPLLSLLFYYGNKGYIWDYYFTGVYPVVALIVAAIFIFSVRLARLAIVAVVFLVGLFFVQNFQAFIQQFAQAFPGYITLSQQVKAVDWVYNDASGRPFNTDVYVPPVIPLAYDYLFLWRGTTVFNKFPSPKLTTALYLLYEPDNEHQTLRNTWLTRQASIGSIEETHQFGLITVDRLHRFKLTD